MATAAEAAKEFISEAQVIEAARRFLDRFPLTVLCHALGNAQGEDAGFLMTALERVTEFEEVRTSFLQDASLAEFLKQGVLAVDPQVRKMSARLLERLAQSETSIFELANYGLVATCEGLLLDEDTGTAESAAKVLGLAARWSAGRAVVFGCGGDVGVIARLHERLGALRDTERIRVLHLFVELGRTSQEAFALMEKTGAYKDVLASFFTSDILLKLNAVELMDALGSFQAGQEFLAREGVPVQLAEQLTDPMNDASVRVCVARLLGFVLLRAPDNMNTLLPGKEAPFAQTIAEYLDSRDPTERLCALHAWANISMNAVGLVFFSKWANVWQTIISSVSATQQEVSKGAMASWTRVLEQYAPPDAGAMEVDGCGAAPLWEAAERQLLPSVLKNLQAKPFPEVRVHTWQLLAALTQSRAVAQRQLTSEELQELLFDFASEQNSDARIAKHEFVVALLKHQGDWLGQFLDENVEKALKEYARQGPHWVPREAAAAVADSGA